MSFKNKVLAILAFIVLIWILTPIPEGAIILTLLGFATGLLIDWRVSILTAMAGFLIGIYVVRKIKLLEKLKSKTR